MKQEPSRFTRFSFLKSEAISAGILTDLQEARIRTDMADIADNILNLQFDVTNPAKFAQDESYLKGQLAFCDFLLLRSEESKNNAKAAEASSAQ